MRTTPERKAALTLLNALEPFFRTRGTIPARQIQAFLLVAAREGQSVSEYAVDVKESPTTMSRNLLDMGERNRHMQPGAGLIEYVWDVKNAKQHFLTAKGRELMADVARRLNDRKPQHELVQNLSDSGSD